MPKEGGTPQPCPQLCIVLRADAILAFKGLQKAVFFSIKYELQNHSFQEDVIYTSRNRLASLIS